MALMAKIWTWATLVGGEWPTTATHALPVGFSVFRFFIFFYKFNCTDPGLQLGDPAPLIVCCCGLADILYLYLICLFFTVTRQRTFPGVWAFQANPYRLGRLSQKRISVGKFEEEGRAGTHFQQVCVSRKTVSRVKMSNLKMCRVWTFHTRSPCFIECSRETNVIDVSVDIQWRIEKQC